MLALDLDNNLADNADIRNRDDFDTAVGVDPAFNDSGSNSRVRVITKE
ncbi:hypothetical protein ACFO1V_13820 [Daeguia caeni]|uniref:Uncharacterized protein n=1 Tax=Daeguia caeni TaxID=439612 RepID=A0ABV9H9X3_9HYPH